MIPKRWDGATWKGDGVSGGSYTSGPFKVVLHTTETAGMPGYNSGKYAPHITYYPRFRKFYQHTEFDVAARALKNETGGVQTNRDSAIQVEIICYSDEDKVDEYGGTRIKVSELTDEHFEDLRSFLEFAYEAFGVKRVWPEKQAYNYGQANAPGFRMTQSEWDNFGGVCAHQHIPENTHWDTGALNWNALYIGEEMITRHSKADEGSNALKPFFDEMVAEGVFSEHTQPGGVTFNDEFATLLARFEDHIVEKYNLGQNPDCGCIKDGDTIQVNVI